MLKPYREKATAQDQGVHSMLLVALEKLTEKEEFPLYSAMTGDSVKLKDSTVLANFESKIQHVSTSRQVQLSSLVNKFADKFPDVPKQTTLTLHDVEVGNCDREAEWSDTHLTDQLLSPDFYFVICITT